MSDLRVYCVYHTASMIGSFPRSEDRVTVPMLLPDITIPEALEFGDSCESRALVHLAVTKPDIPESYVAFVQASWPQKFAALDVDDAFKLRLPGILAPVADCDWYRKSLVTHPGIEKYLDPWIGKHYLWQSRGPGVFCNSMIMDRNLWNTFLTDWLTVYQDAIAMFDPESLDFGTPTTRPEHKAAYLCERITTAITSCYGNVKGLGFRDADGVVQGYTSA